MGADLYWREAKDHTAIYPCWECDATGRVPCKCGESTKPCPKCAGECHTVTMPPEYRVCKENMGIQHVLTKRYELDCERTARLDGSDMEYLQGLADGGMKDAHTLIAAINQHGSIIIGLGC